ncbi:MAG TPA: sigma-54 dependent transcriptional regulator [Pyrinomonadaceae bacterium]|nr:sigma-54-dependent Fis family transcriptional regulator [Chloracidobacterium sp.]MBP9935107.1 sigma-54-dependent Fis family transcriptional regulator [Pyrinomonadaceae bacterium]MBK7803467.1 sigma-54-dependent Fis family transcriptional regulator [Chloracidobacterium sp.]MBK9438716.1 sigma-54-dependent Fis family transcriptional regulator [Chloracidobacterium sp.]MBL0241242.1 sigma-54-dependent Fis family transcriptional regulator [Chloracidobacterium sp.]
MGKKGSILVCDDEEIMRDVLETILSGAGYKVDLAKTGEQAIELYEHRPYDLVLMDVSMPGMGGLTALEHLVRIDSEAAVLMVTAYATFDTAISAWEKGAAGVIRKPFQNEQILALIAKGIRGRRNEEERKSLRQAMSRSVKREGFIGRSDVMEVVFRLVDRVAPARSTVLITGESGTGKELVAKAIHEASPRADEPFVAVNCSNIPSELLESELFGHTRGAFTGAVAAKKGLFEVADGGSIFLDEIGDLRPELQVKLLRVIQEREFTPLGDTAPLKVDVRIIAATNIDLKEAVKNGTFREDLYYRLSVVPIELPALRDRREDILPLAQHFIRKYSEENARQISEQLSPEVLSLLENYYYPGNVRELENIIERAVVIAQTDDVTVDCLRPEVSDPARALDMIKRTEGSSGEIDIARGVNFYDEIKKFEIDLIRRALDQTGGHQSRAARLLGLNATTLNSKIKTHHIPTRT